MVLVNGDKHTFESWDQAQAFWFQTTSIGLPKVINVLDKPKKKQTKAKGF